MRTDGATVLIRPFDAALGRVGYRPAIAPAREPGRRVGGVDRVEAGSCLIN
ncbi:hypothetical protein ACLBXO_30365 [Methylobacterium sp. C33D]